MRVCGFVGVCFDMVTLVRRYGQDKTSSCYFRSHTRWLRKLQGVVC